MWEDQISPLLIDYEAGISTGVFNFKGASKTHINEDVDYDYKTNNEFVTVLKPL